MSGPKTPSINPNLPQRQAKPRPEIVADLSPCGACTVRHLSVCSALSAEELVQLSDFTTHVELQPGQPLFGEAEPANHVFNVTAGTLKVYKLLPDGRCQVMGFLFPGDFLGLANSATYAFSADAVNTATLCRFPRKKFAEFLLKFPQMEKKLLSVASHELSVAQEQMLLLGRKTAKERLASFLLTLSRHAERRGAQGNPISVPMSRADIADYLGLTTETVSRAITLLKKAGLIGLEKSGSIALLDSAALREIAEGF